jgi:hypothetical protein
MILRRLSQSLKEQNWMAIVIEFILLVSGVFLGIQVANWNEARVERELVRGHLSEIARDLHTHISFSHELELSAMQRISAVDYIHAQAFGTRLPTTIVLAGHPWKAPNVMPFPANQLNQLLSAVNLTRVSVRARNGYESMVSSGRIGLIRNRKLASLIQTYYGNYDDLLDTQANVFRPFRNQGAQDQYAIGLSVFDQRPASEIVALARENRGFAAYLRSQREWGILNYNLVHNINLETQALQAAINKELSEP